VWPAARSGLEADTLEQGHGRSDVGGTFVDRVAARPEADVAFGREVIGECGGELRGEALLSRAKAFAVAFEGGMLRAVLDGGRAAREEDEARLVAVIAVHRAVTAACARVERIGGLFAPAAAAEAQLVEPIHLDLRDVRLATARRGDRTCVPAHLRAERAVVELARDAVGAEWLGVFIGHRLRRPLYG
jgi:hypothetical protein